MPDLLQLRFSDGLCVLARTLRKQHFLHEFHAPLPALHCAVEAAALRGAEEGGAPEGGLPLRPILRAGGVVAADDEGGGAGAAGALQGVFGVVGEGGGEGGGEDDVAHAAQGGGIGAVEPGDDGRHARAVGDDGGVAAVDGAPRPLYGVLPLGDALAAGGGGGAHGGVAERPAVYPHFGFVGIADEQQGEVFQFLALHGGRVVGKKRRAEFNRFALCRLE